MMDSHVKVPEGMEWTLEFWVDVQCMNSLVDRQERRIEELETANKKLSVKNEMLRSPPPAIEIDG